MTTRSKGAGKALRLSMPAAAETWHYMPGIPGLYHPTHITPLADIEGLDDEAARVLVDNPNVHLEFVDATEDELKAASKELLKASHGAMGGVRDAARIAGSEEEERSRIRAAADSARAVTTKTDKEA